MIQKQVNSDTRTLVSLLHLTNVLRQNNIQQEHMHVSMSFRVQSQMKFLSAKVAETNQQ